MSAWWQWWIEWSSWFFFCQYYIYWFRFINTTNFMVIIVVMFWFVRCFTCWYRSVSVCLDVWKNTQNYMRTINNKTTNHLEMLSFRSVCSFWHSDQCSFCEWKLLVQKTKIGLFVYMCAHFCFSQNFRTHFCVSNNTIIGTFVLLFSIQVLCVPNGVTYTK